MNSLAGKLPVCLKYTVKCTVENIHRCAWVRTFFQKSEKPWGGKLMCEMKQVFHSETTSYFRVRTRLSLQKPSVRISENLPELGLDLKLAIRFGPRPCRGFESLPRLIQSAGRAIRD